MIIWILMAIGLVVIVAGGFAGRARMDRYRSEPQSATHHANHGGRSGHRSRGRGRGRSKKRARH